MTGAVRPPGAGLTPRLLLAASALVLGAGPVSAQDRMILWSQRGAVSQRVAETDIAITYSRPVARGGTLFGGVVPWDRVWNPGADSATTLTVSRPIEVEGEPLPAGRYTLWAIPRPETWTLIVSRAVDIMHTPYPGDSLDVLRLAVRPERGSHMETLAFYSPVVDADSAVLRLHWGDTMASLRLRAPN